MTGDGMYAPGSGYGELVIIWTTDGPAVDGAVPARIGVERQALEQMVPALGAWQPADGELRVLSYQYRLVGQDGPDILVFERVGP